MKNAGFMSLDFACYFEPEGGIRTPQEFTGELVAWAERTKRDMTILEEGMEPIIQLDGKNYICRLAEPSLAEQNNPIWKLACKQGITHSIGKFLGYKWVYLYEKTAD